MLPQRVAHDARFRRLLQRAGQPVEVCADGGRSPGVDGGFTLIELMVASFIFLIVIAMVLVTAGAYLQNQAVSMRTLTGLGDGEQALSSIPPLLRAAVVPAPPVINWGTAPGTAVWLACPYEAILYSEPPEALGGTWVYLYLTDSSGNVVTSSWANPGTWNQVTTPLLERTEYTLHAYVSPNGPSSSPPSAAPASCSGGAGFLPSSWGSSAKIVADVPDVVFAPNPYTFSCPSCSELSSLPLFTYWSGATGGNLTGTSGTSGDFPQNIDAIGFDVRMQRFRNVQGAVSAAGAPVTVSEQVVLQNIASASGFGAGGF